MRGFTNSSLVPSPSSERDSLGSLGSRRIRTRISSPITADRRGNGTSNASTVGTGAMLLDDCLWLHDDEDILPASPHLPQDGLEEPIQSAQKRAWAVSV
jgi:hypothetical protein